MGATKERKLPLGTTKASKGGDWTKREIMGKGHTGRGDLLFIKKSPIAA